MQGRGKKDGEKTGFKKGDKVKREMRGERVKGG